MPWSWAAAAAAAVCVAFFAPLGCSSLPAIVNPSQSQCEHPRFSALPFCDRSGAIDARVADLVSRMTMAEKISLMGNANAAQPVPRLGVAALPWGEALHGVVSQCFQALDGSPGLCPTSFPHALAMAASFNRTLWRAVGDAISTEARALNNLGTADDIGTGPWAPLMLWAPNLNPYRDPRWGRGQETPGECPYLGAEYGVQFILGLQNGAGTAAAAAGGPPRYLKAVSVVKHSFDYDIEGNHGPAPRGAFDAVVGVADQRNYFWPPFKAVVTRAKAGGLMCSYNSVNGVPSCMNPGVNNDLVRGEWGMDGLIVSDCGAVSDAASTSYIKVRFNGSVEAQVAQGLRGGCDFNCGKFYQAHIPSALLTGAINGTDIDVAVSRLLKKAFQLGLFDPVDAVPYTKYGAERLNSTVSRSLALAASQQSIVLLKNDPVPTPPSPSPWSVTAAGSSSAPPPPSPPLPLLPLKAGTTRVAMIGPHMNATTDMLSQYRGINHDVDNHTPLLAMTRRGNVVASAVGTALAGTDASGIPAAVAAARKADVAVVLLGLHPQWFDSTHDGDSQEGEDLDRANISLAAIQLQLLQAIEATGVPVVLVLINGGQLSIPWAKDHIPAIVEAFYPGQLGGDAIASVLYGDVSPSGRLPYTMYDASFTRRRPNIGDMSLSANGGITYQYFDGTPLWPFGWGLSFTTFELEWESAPRQAAAADVLRDAVQQNARAAQAGGLPAFSVSVTNTGNVTSDVAVLAFISLADGDSRRDMERDGAHPQRELCGFCRLRAVAPGATALCEIDVAAQVVAHNGKFWPGSHFTVSVEVGDGGKVQGELVVL